MHQRGRGQLGRAGRILEAERKHAGFTLSLIGLCCHGLCIEVMGYNLHF